MVVANSKIEQWWGDWKISFAENWKEDERLINWIRNRVRVAGGAHYQSICAILGNKLVFIYFIYLFIKILNFVIYLVLMKGKERKIGQFSFSLLCVIYLFISDGSAIENDFFFLFDNLSKIVLFRCDLIWRHFIGNEFFQGYINIFEAFALTSNPFCCSALKLSLHKVEYLHTSCNLLLILKEKKKKIPPRDEK